MDKLETARYERTKHDAHFGHTTDSASERTDHGAHFKSDDMRQVGKQEVDTDRSIYGHGRGKNPK